MDKQQLDIFWLLTSAALVFLMQPGFMCLESGLTRSKNSINVAIKNFADFGVSVLLFWSVGYGLMFGASQMGWIGGGPFFVPVDSGGSYLVAFFLFQAMFCGTATTILSGAVAERMRFAGYLVVTVLLSGVIFPLFGHWAWSGNYGDNPDGWLGRLGFVDFAGSSVVHSVGGWVALAAVLVLGPRSGRFPPGQPPRRIPGQNLPMAVLGVLLMWLGWIGFNGGSTLAWSDRIPGIVANTLLAGCGGMGAALAAGWSIRRRPDVDLLTNGALAGLVSITASCHAVSAPAAVTIGGCGGLVMLAFAWLLERWRIDDVVGAVPVHAGAGVWGTLAVALFGRPQALDKGLSVAAQFGVQLLGVGVCFLWSFGVVYLALRLVDRLLPLRVTAEQEQIGLNVAEHGASSELQDLVGVMHSQAQSGDRSLRAPVEPFTEIGQIATLYNEVMDALEQALAESEAIVLGSNDAIVTFSQQDVKIKSVNPRTLEMFGREENELLDQPVSLLLASGEDSDGAAAALRALVAAGPSGRRELVGCRGDGSQFPMEVTVVEASLPGQPLYAGTFRDITRRRRHAEQLQHYAEELERSNRDLADFASVASHDLQAPLRRVATFCQLLRRHCEGKLDGTADEFLGYIADGTSQMQALIDDLLAYARVSTRGKPFAPVECEEVVDRAIANLQPRIAETDAEVTRGPLPKVAADATQLLQLFQNLLENALKYRAERPPRVHVEAAREAAGWQFRVRDNGIGIPAHQSQRIFVIFQRLHRDEHYDGTGVGLSICKRIVSRHGGRIWVESEPGVGSTFCFTLPERGGAISGNGG